MINRRFQIAISHHTASDTAGAGAPLSRWGRFKTLLASLVFAIAAIAVVIVAFIFGYAIAAVVCVVIVIVIAFVLIKSVLQRAVR